MRTSQISLWVDEIHRRRLAELTRLTGCSNSELARLEEALAARRKYEAAPLPEGVFRAEDGLLFYDMPSDVQAEVFRIHLRSVEPPRTPERLIEQGWPADIVTEV